MSFINLRKDINEVKEPETVPEGMYNLAIEKAMEKNNDQGVLTGINVILDVQDHLEAAAVFHHVSIPQEDDEETTADFKYRFMKKFLDTFGIPYSKKGFDLADFIGAGAKVKLTLENYQGDISNKIKL